MKTATLLAPAQAQQIRPGTGGNRIPELDGLRGLAIAMVILFHYAIPTVGVSNAAVTVVHRAFRIGWSGVDLFFVLSGFLIGGILLDAKESKHYFQTFYARRVYRIFPIYYAWVAIYFLLAAVVSAPLAQKLGIVQHEWIDVPVFLLYLQNTWKLNETIRSIWLFHLWSLAVEEQFYLVIPWLIRFLSRAKLLWFLVLTLFLAPACRIILLVHFPEHESLRVRLTACRADALACGVLLALAWRSKTWKTWILNHRKAIYAPLCVLGLASLYLAIFEPDPGRTMSIWGYTCLDLFFANLLLLALVAREGSWAGFCRWSFLRDLGGVSYCMYILHPVTNHLLHAALAGSQRGISTWPALAATILAAGGTWALAKFSWRYFESPLVRRAHVYHY